jgi:hypothetical protein
MSFSSPMIRRRSRQRRYGSGALLDALSEAFARSAGTTEFGAPRRRGLRPKMSTLWPHRSIRCRCKYCLFSRYNAQNGSGTFGAERGRPEVGRPEPGPWVRVAGSGRSPSIQRPPFGIIPASIGLGSNPYQVRDKQSGTASLRPGLVSAPHAGGAPVPQGRSSFIHKLTAIRDLRSLNPRHDEETSPTSGGKKCGII